MKSRTLLSFVISGFLIQTGCSGGDEQARSADLKPVQVSAITAQPQTISSFIEAPGTVQARNRILLSSQLNGFVREVRIRAGDVVAKDQLLVLLDARDAENQISAAQAGIEEAQAALAEARGAREAAVQMRAAARASTELAGQTLARYEKLSESRSVSSQELDEVRTRRNAAAAELASREAMVAAAEERIKQAEARISQAKAQAGRADVMLSWTHIKAPSSARVVQRFADPGTAVFPGTSLLVLESMDRPQALADIPADHAGILRTGTPVDVLSGQETVIAQGRISEIIPLSSPATHSIQFKVDLPAEASALTSGLFVKVRVPAGTREALLAPRSAVRQTGQLTGVFIIDSSSKARFRLVKTAPYDTQRVEILSGLRPGERIVSRLSNQVIEGVPLEVRS